MKPLRLATLISISLLAIPSLATEITSTPQSPIKLPQVAVVDVRVTKSDRPPTLVTSGTVSVVVDSDKTPSVITPPVPFSATRAHSYVKSNISTLTATPDSEPRPAVALVPATIEEGFSSEISFAEREGKISGTMSMTISNLIKLETVRVGAQFVQFPKIETSTTQMSLEPGVNARTFGGYTVEVTVTLTDTPALAQ